MIEFESIIKFVDSVLDSKRKRHIVGGIFMSISFMFGSLAITTMTLKEEKNE